MDHESYGMIFNTLGKAQFSLINFLENERKLEEIFKIRKVEKSIIVEKHMFYPIPNQYLSIMYVLFTIILLLYSRSV